MSTHRSAPADLVLHAPRVLGFASSRRIASRYALDPAQVEDKLLDYEVFGWVSRASFAESSGWYLTESGRSEDERRLAEELRQTGTFHVVADLHRRFIPLNGDFTRTCTDWQIQPSRSDPMAANDHSDWRWDERVLDSLSDLGEQLANASADVAAALHRFAGYGPRYAHALAMARDGDGGWVDLPDRDSLHTVWIQLHEDLLSTLGIPRGA